MTEWHNFDSSAAAAEQAAQSMAAVLSRAVGERGRAVLAAAVSAAALPALELLAQADLPWACITICPAADCCVPMSDPRSREAVLRAVFGRGRSAAARFIGLYVPSPTADSAAFSASARLSHLSLPPDCLVLDMDREGQTAGLMRDSPKLKQALAADCRALILPHYSKTYGETYLAMTMPLLISARRIILPLRGEAALPGPEEMAKNSADEDMPIRAILRRTLNPAEIYWAPE